MTLRRVDVVQRQHSLAANLRKTILDTALEIVDPQGIEGLTQPKLPKPVGIRQSYLST